VCSSNVNGPLHSYSLRLLKIYSMILKNSPWNENLKADRGSSGTRRLFTGVKIREFEILYPNPLRDAE